MAIAAAGGRSLEHRRRVDRGAIATYGLEGMDLGGEPMDAHFNSAYFKRYRMDIVLPRAMGDVEVSPDYRFVPWHDGLLDAHARTKFRAFRSEIDAHVFPCLGDVEGCRRLMREIRGKAGFLPAACWLVARSRVPAAATRSGDGDGERLPAELEWCGTIQGILDAAGNGSIQNIGVVPGHRGQGLATALIDLALRGFAAEGAVRASLEVTADNWRAVRLYQKLGFRRAKTIYKVVDGPSWQSRTAVAALS